MDMESTEGTKLVFQRLGPSSSTPANPNFHQTNRNQQQQQKLCFQWQAGRCYRHPCPFLHRELLPPSSFSSSVSTSSNGGGKNPNFHGTWRRVSGARKKVEKVCKFWVQGSCNYGEKCKFLHSSSIGDCCTLLTTLEGHQKVVTGIDLRGGKDEHVRIWDCQSGQNITMDNPSLSNDEETNVDVGKSNEEVDVDHEHVEGCTEPNEAEIIPSDENLDGLKEPIENDENENGYASFQRKKRRKTSRTWQDFDINALPNGEKKAECKYCKPNWAYLVSWPTTHLLKHAETCAQKKLLLKRQKKLQFQHAKSKIEITPLSDEKYDHGRQREAIAHWILMHEKPFRVVEEDGFTFMMKVNLPQFEKISTFIVRTDCMSVYEIEKKKLKDQLRTINKISLTTDIWKSKVQKVSYMCITGHFIDSNWELQKRVISFVALPPHHTGVDIADVLFKCMKEWEIENKIFTISVDNAANNDVALRILKQTFSKSGKLFLGGKLFHVRCVAQILNLIAQDGLSNIKDIIDIVKESVGFINHSEERLKKFSKVVHYLGIHVKSLIIDCPTRWNSTYEMLVAALKVKDAFPIFSQMEPTYDCCLSYDDWGKVEQVLDILEVFFEAIQVVSGNDYPTSNLFFGAIWRVKEVLDEKESHVDEYVRTMVKKMKYKFDKYWEECNLFMAMAAVLDPRYKMLLVDFAFKEIYPGYEARANISRVRDSLHELYNEYVAISQSSHKVRSDPTSILESKFSLDGNGVTKKREIVPYGLSRFDQYLNTVGTIAPVKSELDIYLEEGVYRCHKEEEVSQFDALAWWKVNESKFKVLSKMACDVLAIPVSTVASEATFSAGIKVLDPYRASLSSEMLQMLICGGDWVRRLHGVKKQPKSHEEEPVEVVLYNPFG